MSENFRVYAHMPLGEFYIGTDPLSAFFLLLLFIVSLAAGIYGYGYLRDYTGQRNVGVHLALYHWLIIVMVLVLVAKNAVLFLAAWELMTVVSYFLITFTNESEQVRKAGYIYLIATHVGVFCLVFMFLVMGAQAGSMNFDQMMATQFPLGLVGITFYVSFCWVSVLKPDLYLFIFGCPMLIRLRQVIFPLYFQGYLLKSAFMA